MTKNSAINLSVTNNSDGGFSLSGVSQSGRALNLTSGSVTLQGGAVISDGQFLIGNSSTNSFDQGNISGGNGIQAVAGPGGLRLNVTGNYAISPQYITISGSGIQLTGNFIYKMNSNNSRVFARLPSSGNLGDSIYIRGYGTSGWTIQQNSGNVIHGGSDTTIGTSGSLASQTRYDTVNLECVNAPFEWIITSNRGTLTFV